MLKILHKSSIHLRLSPLISAYLRLSRIWGIFWFINSRNENTLTKLNLTIKLDGSHLVEIQNMLICYYNMLMCYDNKY